MRKKSEQKRRYAVQANKNLFFSDSFETPEEAILEASRLVHEGYAVVSVRDTEGDGDLW